MSPTPSAPPADCPSARPPAPPPPSPPPAPSPRWTPPGDLQHTLSFRNEGAADRAKPEGVRGCEIWCVTGPGPASVADARYLATDTASPYLATFDAADAGKTVHYFFRWVNARNESGPWSATVAATIGG